MALMPILKSYRKEAALLAGQKLQIKGQNTTTSALTIEDSTYMISPADTQTLCKQGRLNEALCILHVIGQLVGFSTYDFLLHACLNKKALTEGKLVHAHMIQIGFQWQDTSLGNKLVSLYAKCGSLVDGYAVLNQMPMRDVVSWTVMIAAYAKHGFAEEALRLFKEMRRTGIQADQYAFASVLPACVNLKVVKEVHGEIMRTGFHSDVFVGSALVDMYAKCGSIEDSQELFDRMPERNVVSWNTMIAGYAQNGDLDKALRVFLKMPQQNLVSWNSMIAGYLQNGKLEEALKLFKEMPERNVVSWNSMVAGYAKNGFVDEALKLFRTMPEKNEVTWTAVIAGCAQNGCAEEALRLFREMELAGMKPNSKTFASVLPACAELAALEQGMEIHQEIIRSGFKSDVIVGNALLDMYAKCGSIDKARSLFNEMPQCDVISWNTMITGYAMHGCEQEALRLFEQMPHFGFRPDHVTFVGILSACCHSGLVDKGCQYFDSMSRDYNITPSMDHYSCMVDLLGRAGLLDEAKDFIDKMPIKPEAIVWRCLLSACRIHNNRELGEYVAGRLFQLNPQSDSPYVLLSNIYGTAGRWDDIEKLRKRMNSRSIKKKPGCSWIEVDKQVHAFFVGDRLHPQTQETYAKLDIHCWGEMRTTGA